jgi:hypothetical protein
MVAPNRRRAVVLITQAACLPQTHAEPDPAAPPAPLAREGSVTKPMSLLAHSIASSTTPAAPAAPTAGTQPPQQSATLDATAAPAAATVGTQQLAQLEDVNALLLSTPLASGHRRLSSLVYPLTPARAASLTQPQHPATPAAPSDSAEPATGRAVQGDRRLTPNRPISVSRLGEMPIQSCGQSVALCAGKRAPG